ncbi:MAG: pyridoxal-phosphate dependent enzyme [Xanthomonadales bacterium]|nr:pyridoxal-phosphate dependent enzyme [Xanthomonadales bacterium]
MDQSSHIEAFFQQHQQLKCQDINMLGVTVRVVRDDLNHPVVQGNKFRKLKHNLLAAAKQRSQNLVTFGGAYSNHLIATAYAANELGFSALGFVRGDELEGNHAIWSETLFQCQQLGMRLEFVSRTDYRLKEQASSIKHIIGQLNHPFIIPEGGSNQLAKAGVAELVTELVHQRVQPSQLICPVGTGGTMAGLIEGVAQHNMDCQVLGVAVLKGLQGVKDDIIQWLGNQKTRVNWKILHDYHCGGYAKSTPELEGFCIGFTQQHGIPLDKIYNSKSFYALAQCIKSGEISTKDRPAIIHTGGLQGGVFETL